MLADNSAYYVTSVLVGLIAILATGFLVWRFAKWMARSALSLASGDKTALLITLVALTVSYLIEPELVDAVVNWLAIVPKLVYRMLEVLHVPEDCQNCSEVLLSQLRQLPFILLQGIGSSTGAYLPSMRSVLVFASCTLVLSALLRLVIVGDGSFSARWADLASRATGLARPRTVISASMLVLGAYLSVVSIIAIPSLDQSSVTVDRQALEGRLKAIQLTPTDWAERFPETVAFDGFKDGSNDPAADLSFAIQQYVSRYQASRLGLKSAEQTNLNRLVDYFSAENEGRKGQVATNRHAQAIATAYLDWSSHATALLDRCLAGLRATASLMGYVRENRHATGELAAFWEMEIGRIIGGIRSPTNECGKQPSDVTYPQRTYGGDGPKWLEAYLLGLGDSTSPWVAIVFGMLGAGLLGSALATFRDPQATTNIASTTARSVGGALIVFLAIYGGILVFTQGAEPNPYLVLFACLAGAVFHDEVWAWVSKRFGSETAANEQRIQPGSGMPAKEVVTAEDT